MRMMTGNILIEIRRINVVIIIQNISNNSIYKKNYLQLITLKAN